MSAFEIPESAWKRCLSCNAKVALDDPRVAREVIGFSLPRGGGGQNHVLFREETGRLLCETCTNRRRYAGHSLQGALE